MKSRTFFIVTIAIVVAVNVVVIGPPTVHTIIKLGGFTPWLWWLTSPEQWPSSISTVIALSFIAIIPTGFILSHFVNDDEEVGNG